MIEKTITAAVPISNWTLHRRLLAFLKPRCADAFDDYMLHDSVVGFGSTVSAEWASLGLDGINAKVAFSPHAADNALLDAIADNIRGTTTSSLL
jgi:hypothetical protein